MREISTQEQMSEMSEVCGATYYPPMTSRVVTTDIVSLVISRVCAEGAHNTIRCFPSAEHIGVLACNSAQSARTAGAVPYPITRPPHFPTTHPRGCTARQLGASARWLYAAVVVGSSRIGLHGTPAALRRSPCEGCRIFPLSLARRARHHQTLGSAGQRPWKATAGPQAPSRRLSLSPG